jgi:type IV pilus modification protein PilV
MGVPVKSASAGRGFTLVEALVALTILLVGLTGAAGLVSRTIEKSASARKLTEGQFLALQVLERLRAEVRVDAEPTGGSCDGSQASKQCAGGAKFEVASAWKAERLPYSTVDLAAGDGSCNPTDVDDGVAYDVGPLPVRHDGNEFLVCYRLDKSTVAVAGLPPNSVDARVKVLWRNHGGWGATWLSGVLLDGR